MLSGRAKMEVIPARKALSLGWALASFSAMLVGGKSFIIIYIVNSKVKIHNYFIPSFMGHGFPVLAQTGTKFFFKRLLHFLHHLVDVLVGQRFLFVQEMKTQSVGFLPFR